MAATAWTPEKVLGFRKAFSDFLGHVYIYSKDEIGETLIQLLGSQRRFLNEVFEGLSRDIHFFVILKARQLGLSTITRILILFWAFMHPGLRIALVYDNEANKEEARRELRNILDHLPKSHSIGVRDDNKDFLEFENDARIALLVAGMRKSKTTGGLGRSRGINCVGATEVSSWGDVDGLRSFERSLSDKHENRLYIWESTARGPNIFKTIWDEAVADELTKKSIFIGWWAHEGYAYEEGSPLFEKYGFPPSPEERQKIIEVFERYGHEVTLEQLAWYRHQHDPNVDHSDDERAGQDIIQQELPWCVVGETRVGTNCGIIPIREARAGMFNAFGGISAAGPTGVAQTYEAVTSLGYRLNGTGNHPLAVGGGEFVGLKDSQGRQVILSAPMFAEDEYVVRWKDGPVDCALRVTPDFARLVGLYMGDGSLYGAPRSGYQFSIACDAKDQDVVIEVVRLIKAVFGIDAQPRMVGSGCADVRVASKDIFELFKTLGLTRNDTVKTMRKVHVPEFIWRSPRHVVREFLRGLFEADGFNGYKGVNRVSFFSKWPAFLEDVQLLLLAFGITCKRTSRKAKTSYVKNGVRREHSYTANEITLRSNEAISFNEQIGFISCRKIERGTKNIIKNRGAGRLPLAMTDTVESVSQMGLDEVYNLTVTPNHVFDANGILTHNTEDEAFLRSGDLFFNPDKIFAMQTAAKLTRPIGYRYFMSEDFLETKIEEVPNMRHAQLKVWQEPEPNAVYCIGADPIGASSEDHKRHTAQVIRCYADGFDQVAEYCSQEGDTRNFAWVILHLCGAYGGQTKGARFLLELNGSGNAVWQEIKTMTLLLKQGYLRGPAQERGLTNIMDNVRNFLWTKDDMLSQSPSAFHWETNTKRKVMIMETLRSHVNMNAARIRSLECLNEMVNMVRDGDKIEADGDNKYDRIIPLALGVRAWEAHERKPLIGQQFTRSAAEMSRTYTGEDLHRVFQQNIVQSFFASQRRARVEQGRAARRGNRWNF